MAEIEISLLARSVLKPRLASCFEFKEAIKSNVSRRNQSPRLFPRQQADRCSPLWKLFLVFIPLFDLLSPVWSACSLRPLWIVTEKMSGLRAAMAAQ